jgi:hypothetical protein
MNPESDNLVEISLKRIAGALTMRVNVIQIGEALNNNTVKVRSWQQYEREALTCVACE